MADDDVRIEPTDESDEGLAEFLDAVKAYQATTGRLFVTPSECLTILTNLGWMRLSREDSKREDKPDVGRP